MSHIIDCNAPPEIPDDYQVERHLKGGMLEWSPAKVRLLEPCGEDRHYDCFHLDWRDGWWEFCYPKMLNANVLDFLLNHRECIPDEWKYHTIAFMGTEYRRHEKRLVCCLNGSGRTGMSWSGMYADVRSCRHYHVAVFDVFGPPAQFNAIRAY